MQLIHKQLSDRVLAAAIEVHRALEPGRFESAYDVLIENEIVVEIKAVERVLPVHGAQSLTKLRLLNNRVGFLLNLNTAVLKSGITRLVR